MRLTTVADYYMDDLRAKRRPYLVMDSGERFIIAGADRLADAYTLRRAMLGKAATSSILGPTGHDVGERLPQSRPRRT